MGTMRLRSDAVFHVHERKMKTFLTCRKMMARPSLTLLTTAITMVMATTMAMACIPIAEAALASAYASTSTSTTTAGTRAHSAAFVFQSHRRTFGPTHDTRDGRNHLPQTTAQGKTYIGTHPHAFDPHRSLQILQSSTQSSGDDFDAAQQPPTVHLSTHQANYTLTRPDDDLEYQYEYKYNKLTIQHSSPQSGSQPSSRNGTTTGVLLIHPIGVGIGRWFYDRLLHSIQQHVTAAKSTGVGASDTTFFIPDLLGSDSASNPSSDSNARYPLLNISDWTSQLESLLHENDDEITDWYIVANGGCSPIALQLAAARSASPNIILSSLPSLPFFLNATDPKRVARSYRILCGPLGQMFWWYACRPSFIENFSKRNLIANATKLGADWIENCVSCGKQNRGRSKYATFAFLAGTLQDGCVASLARLQQHASSSAVIHTIRGLDKRPNEARSVFWKKRKKPQPTQKTFREYIEGVGLAGREEYVNGRISLAYEDPDGYAAAIFACMNDGGTSDRTIE